jgi:hypothetical protein
MSNWTPSVDNPEYIEKTIQAGQATIVISRPVLSEEERTAREGRTRTTLESVMRDYLKRRR